MTMAGFHIHLDRALAWVTLHAAQRQLASHHCLRCPEDLPPCTRHTRHPHSLNSHRDTEIAHQLPLRAQIWPQILSAGSGQPTARETSM